LGDHSYFGYLRVDDAERYYNELTAKRVEMLSPISDKPWGMREFGLRTPEGHRITIGQWIGENISELIGTTNHAAPAPHPNNGINRTRHQRLRCHQR